MANGADEEDFAEAGEEQKLPELKLGDARQALSFIKFFKGLPEDSQVVRFFDRKEFYSVHGDDALFIAKNYHKTMAAVKQLGNPPDTLAGLSLHRKLFETVLRDLLLERGDHTVEMYEGSGSNWRLTKTATPGKLGSFEDVLFNSSNEMQESPVVMAIFPSAKENERLVGMAFVDITKRLIGATEFLDDDQYTNLESAIVALGCKEMVLPQDGAKTPDGRKLRDVMARCEVLTTERKRAEFKARDVELDMARLVKGSAEQHRSLGDTENAAAALAAVLSYTELLADNTNYGKFHLQPYSLDTYMRLDAAALKALNVQESKTDANKTFSLFGLMNRTCAAGMGKRLLNRWLKQPLLNVEQIARRHDVVSAFVEDASVRQDLRFQLKRIPDIERLARKLETKRASLADIVKLYQASVRLPIITGVLERYEGEFASLLSESYTDPLKEHCTPEQLGKYEGLVETAVDLDQIEHGEYIIAPGYDPSLQKIKDERDKCEVQIKEVYAETSRHLGLKGQDVEKVLKMDKNPQHGHVFRLTKKEEPKYRKKITTTPYFMVETRKDGVKFSTSKLKRLSDTYVKLTEEYNTTQKELVGTVVNIAASFVEIFESVAAILSQLDVLLSFADLSVNAPLPYVRPTMTPSSEGDVVLMGSRHPCVEVQDDVSFIANDCKLVRGQSWFQIITGPNMGGKSTFIRQVGVNVLMAQVGCFVPCDSADISVRDCIFARVGAGDCQLRGVSTFMAEMLETSAILKAATENSLIIIDELGRGTSTYDGFGLAWAICEYLTEVTRAPTLFATHFHELTALATTAGKPLVHGPPKGPPVGIANLHVSAHIDEETRKLTMLYKVEEGPCDQSFGIYVAEFAHFPESVVALARKKAEELEDFTPEDQQGEGEVGAKRKRVSGPDDTARGAARVRAFLRDFAALPIDQMSPDEAVKAAEDLKKSLEQDAAANPWLQQIL